MRKSRGDRHEAYRPSLIPESPLDRGDRAEGLLQGLAATRAELARGGGRLHDRLAGERLGPLRGDRVHEPVVHRNELPLDGVGELPDPRGVPIVDRILELIEAGALELLKLGEGLRVNGDEASSCDAPRSLVACGRQASSIV